jgi:hypothetical protein
MAESDEPVEAPEEAMARLEAALERIERSAKPADLSLAAVRPNESVIAARLDKLITTLRNALAEATG